MKKKTKLAASVVVMAFLAVLATPLSGMGAEKTYEFKFAWNDIWGPKFRAAQVYRPRGEMHRMVYERSGGRIRLNIISRMFPNMDILQSVATGKADMGDVAMPYHSGTYPLWNWGEVPGVVDEDRLKGFAEENAVYQDPKVIAIYDRTMGKIGLKFWFVTQWEPGIAIWSKKKINTVADMKALKTRVYGYLPTLGVKALGASPVTIASGEVAPAMMAGTVDAAVTSISFGYTMGLHKVAKFAKLLPIASTWSAVTVINAKKYNALPPDLQKALMDVGRELQQMVALSTTAEYIMSKDMVKLSGVEISKFDPGERKKAIEKLNVVEKEWTKLAGSDGQEFLSAIKGAVNRYRAFTGK